MDILVPLNDKKFLDAYIEAGSREFYFGFYDEKWSEEFGEFSDLNRMSGYRKEANANTFDEIKELIHLIRKKEAYSYITFNSAVYSRKEIQKIEEYLYKLMNNPPDGLIISSPELANLASRYHIPFVVSTIAGVYNSDLVSFYKELGAKRIILPRDLSLDEIEMIVKSDIDLEYEVFLMRNGCKFSDANCLGFHRKEMCSICADLDRAEDEVILTKENEIFKNRSNMEYTNLLLKNEFHNYACGLCAIYDFVNWNINAGKVVGRSDHCEAVCEDIKLIKKNIDIAMNCTSKAEYLGKMIFPNEREVMCTNGMACYYPEVRF